MTKREYAQEIANRVNGEVKEVEKANKVILTGIEVGRGTIRPVVYIDEAYASGKTVEETVNVVLKAVKQNEMEIDVNWIYDFEQVKPKLQARLYNKFTTSEVFKSTAEYGFDDLIIIPYIDMQLPDGNMGSIRVTNKMFKKWNVTEEEIIQIAMGNVDYTIMSLAKMISELAGFPYSPEMDEQMPAYVVTNKNKSFGAIGIIKAREEIEKLFPNGYTVLPSSIHEVIVIEGNNEAFTNMVKQVNATEVDPEEVLSDHSYYFE